MDHGRRTTPPDVIPVGLVCDRCLPCAVIGPGRLIDQRIALIKPKKLDRSAIIEHLRQDVVHRHLRKLCRKRREALSQYRNQRKDREVGVGRRVGHKIDRRQRQAVLDQSRDLILRNNAEPHVDLRREINLSEPVGTDARDRKSATGR